MQRFWGEHYSTLMQKAFQYLQMVASSKQLEAKILNHLFFAQSKFLFIVHVMSAGYQNYQQQKQTNMKPVICPEYGTMGIKGLNDIKTFAEVP